MKKILCLALCLLVLGTMGCGKNNSEEENVSNYPIATITMANGGVIKLDYIRRLPPSPSKTLSLWPTAASMTG